MKTYLDGLQQAIEKETAINEALWEKYQIAPEGATDSDWRKLADSLQQEGYELYQKYTKSGIKQFVSEERGAKESGYMIVGKEQILVRQGAFSVRAAQRMEGQLWDKAKGELSGAIGEFLRLVGYTAQDISQANYYQRLRLLEELGQKKIALTKSGKVSTIDKVPKDARAETIEEVDFDLAATAQRVANDPLSVPTLDAYGKMELADEIRQTKLGEMWQ